jgi:3-mercaptopyruvate sulfurtransferase SseA
MEGHSVRAAQLSQAHGFTSVSVLAGGMQAWQCAGLPVSYTLPGVQKYYQMPNPVTPSPSWIQIVVGKPVRNAVREARMTP